MKRLIRKSYNNKSGYKWVDKQVEKLLSKNKDMSEDIAYGIAWNQWKKKHPKWETKKELKENKISRKLKADLYNENDNLKVYKEPTINEINEMKNISPKINAIFTTNNEFYVWPGMVTFNDVNYYCDNPLDLTQIKVTFDCNNWNFDFNDRFDSNGAKEYILYNKNKIELIGNICLPMKIVNCSDGKSLTFDNGINDIN